MKNSCLLTIPLSKSSGGKKNIGVNNNLNYACFIHLSECSTDMLPEKNRHGTCFLKTIASQSKIQILYI